MFSALILQFNKQIHNVTLPLFGGRLLTWGAGFKIIDAGEIIAKAVFSSKDSAKEERRTAFSFCCAAAPRASAVIDGAA